jgi:cytochrome c oxidase subunit 3
MTQLEALRGRGPSTRQEPKVSPSLLGMILFIASEVMFFGGLFGAYFNIRAGFEEWPPAGTPEIEIAVTLALTAVLLSSSVTQHLAVAAINRDDRRGLARWIGVTVCLGLAFLAGQIYEYSTLGFGPSDNVFTTLFFTITGFHGFHVAAGIVILILVMLRANRFSAEHHGHVEAATYYWHFVDAVWLFVFTALYLLTR